MARCGAGAAAHGLGPTITKAGLTITNTSPAITRQQ